MRNKLLASASAIALIAGTSFALAQGAQGAKEKEGGGGPPAAQSAPAEKKMKPGTTGAGPSKETPGVKGGATIEPKAMPKGQSTQGPSQSPKATEAPSKPRETTGQAPSEQPKAKEAPAKQQGTTGQAPGEQPKAGQAPAKQQGTTGQGPAGSSGASLTTDQRTKITTVIKQKRVQPLTNVTFAISVGAVVPATVHFYPLPVEVVEVYPDWRGYLFVLVGDEILVIHPRTHIIVAVLVA